MSQRLKSKVVIATGATAGIGAAFARTAAAEGAHVVVAARGRQAGESIVREISAAGGSAFFVRTDVTREEDAAELVASTVAHYGRLDGVFNNVGGGIGFGPLASIDGSSWREDIELNLSSVFFAMKYQIPALEATGGGAIVNNASASAVVGTPGLAPYTAAKHGVVGLTRAAALDYATAGIRINALITGGSDTPTLRSRLTTDEGRAALAGMHPLQRLAAPGEIAAFALFLLSDEASFVTGAALAVDGGFSAC